ncbi:MULTISPECIES: FmdB family zinc ribbon protein [Actinomycetes]|uniref:Putative regulatory protein FmdB zinc ribbon domain-containing protein n=2 Tax=Actinomycetes TaxID=1760 RepID=A0ABP6LZ33_9MICC|nr:MULTISPECIES: FmdB family zinc ribbon protein [unclassified Nesterenkonia]MDS2173930.1 zinc ribbon domain-containing protein [Nesterenkonia sp. CL21]OSM42708.1 FmdB family transcriptional regulator [Nesterenkonia sp. PF2B19]
MPTYSYACKACGHAFDIVQSFSDDSLTVCPECSGTLRKKFGSVGVTFKGSGFYRTDSRGSSSSSESSSSPSSSSSSAPKPAAASATAD